jgi:hypothetical protein
MSEPKRAKEERRDYGEQDEWGNSIASLRANLKLTPLERIRKAEAFARFVFKIRGNAHPKVRD